MVTKLDTANASTPIIISSFPGMSNPIGRPLALSHAPGAFQTQKRKRVLSSAQQRSFCLFSGCLIPSADAFQNKAGYFRPRAWLGTPKLASCERNHLVLLINPNKLLKIGTCPLFDTLIPEHPSQTSSTSSAFHLCISVNHFESSFLRLFSERIDFHPLCKSSFIRITLRASLSSFKPFFTNYQARCWAIST